MKVPDGNSLETHGVEPVSTEEAQPVSVVEYYEMVEAGKQAVRIAKIEQRKKEEAHS